MALNQRSDGGTDGTTLGQSTTDKISFYGVAPIVQPAVLAAVTTTAAVATFGWGFASSQQALQAVAAINQIVTAMKNLGLMATA